MRKSHPKRKAGKDVKSPSQNRISKQPKSIRKGVSIHWPIGKFRLQSLYCCCCCCFSATKLCLTLCDPIKCSTPCSTVSTISWNLLKFMFIQLPSSHLILCHFLLLSLTFPSIRVISKESATSIRRPKYWSFSFSSSPSNKCSGLVSFMIGLFDLLAAQGGLKSLFQHHNLKASILHCSAFFMVQHSNPYMTSEKTMALTIWTFFSKVMSLLLILGLDL